MMTKQERREKHRAEMVERRQRQRLRSASRTAYHVANKMCAMRNDPHAEHDHTREYTRRVRHIEVRRSSLECGGIRG